MNNHLAPTNATLPASLLTPERAERMRTLFAEANSENTRNTYRKQFRYFVEWCSKHGVTVAGDTAIWPELLASHVEDLHHSGYRLDTIKARVRAVAAFHKEQQAHNQQAGKPVISSPAGHPIVTKLLKGAKNNIAGREQASGDFSQSKRKAEALWIEDLASICSKIDTTSLVGKRDLALVLVGWAGGFRRSELVGLQTTDVKRTEWGFLVTARNTKTKKTVTKQIRREAEHNLWCPARALEGWLTSAGITEGHLFRSFNMDGMNKKKPLVMTNKPLPDKCIETLVKKLASLAGLRPGKWSAHSLRRGYVSQHLAWGVSELAVRRQAGFTPTSPVFFEYVEEARDHTELRSMLSKPTVAR